MSICDNLIDLSSPLPQECAAVQPTASLGLEQLSLDPAPILLTPPVIKQQQTPRLLDTDVLEVKDQPCLLVEQSHASAMEIEEEEVRPQQMEQAAMTSEGQPAQADSPSVACTSGPSQPVAPAESSVQASAQTSSLQPAGPSSAADEQEVVKLKDELSQVVANRDALAREIGEQRATVSKLEGLMTAKDRQIKAQSEELIGLKQRLSGLEKELAAAKVAAGVTPERCRTAARALVDEAERAHGVAQKKEVQVRKLRAVVEREEEELEVLNEFMAQERVALLAELSSLRAELDHERAGRADAEGRAGAGAERVAALEQQLQVARKEVWDTKSRMIEVEAESGALSKELAAAQAAAQAAQAQAAAAEAAAVASDTQLAEVRGSGVKLFKQVRAVAHALERSMATARVPESLQLSVRQLQDWCARLAPYWSDAAAAATAAADAPPGGTGAAAVQAPLAAVGAGASNGGGGGLLALGPEDMTLSLSHMIPANANAGSGGA